MRLARILLLLPAIAAAQPVPVLWTGHPAGSVLHASPTEGFMGVSLVLDDGRWLLPWCDMRDGQGRLFLQTFDPADPAAGGPWTSQDPELGLLPALATPASATSPFQPQLAEDGQGGAYVLWQEQISGESRSELRLQRVSPSGSFAWMADVQVAPDIPLAVASGQDDSGRTPNRSRTILPHATGPWVLWEISDGSVRARRFHPDGTAFAEFPAQGLVIPEAYNTYNCWVDSQGNLLAWSTYGTGLDGLVVAGWSAAGQPLFANQPVRLVAEVDNGWASCAPLEDDGLLVQWLEGDACKAQAFNADLSRRWLQPTVLSTAARGFTLPNQARQAPYHLAVVQADGWFLQRLDAGGSPQWPSPIPIGWAPTVDSGALRAITEDEEGLVYAFQQDSTLVRSLDVDGQTRWSHRLPRIQRVRSLRPGPAGGVDLLLTSSEPRASWIRRLGPDGNVLTDPAREAVLPDQEPRMENEAQLVAGGAQPLFVWSDYESLYLQRVDAASGDPAWGFQEKRLPGKRGTQYIWTLDAGDGGWVVCTGIGENLAHELLQARRVGLSGDSLSPAVLLTPELDPDADYLSQTCLLSRAPGGLYAGLSTYGGQTGSVLQRLDDDGSLRWGGSGVAIGLPQSPAATVLGLDSVAEGVRVLYTQVLNDTTRVFMQVFDEDGQRRMSGHGGLGALVASYPMRPWMIEAQLTGMADGGAVVATRITFPIGTPGRLQRLAADGSQLWERELPFSYLPTECLEDGLGRLWAGQIIQPTDACEAHLWQLDSQGGVSGQWVLSQPALSSLDDWRMVAAGDGVGVATVGYRDDEMVLSGWRVRPDLPATLLFEGPLPGQSVSVLRARLHPAPQGGLFLVWRDGRGQTMDYGDQSRLQRLEFLGDDTGVEPVQPAAFRLEPNVPNPFNPSTEIRFNLAQAGPVRLEVFNLAGQRVRLLADGVLGAGAHRVGFDGRGDEGAELGSGLYFCRLSSRDGMATMRMLLVR